MANRIHPTAVIGAGVELGDGNVIGPYTVIGGPCLIGDGNWIGPHVSIGAPGEPDPEPDRPGPDGPGSAAGPGPAAAGVQLGDRSTVREFVTIRQGVRRPTTLGNACYLMGRSHVDSDVTLDDDVVVASAVQLAPRVRVGAWANIGIGTVVRSDARIGPGAMVGMGSDVHRDVPPFSITVGSPARTTGVNRVGLARRGCDVAAIDALAAFVAGRGGLPSELPEDVHHRLTAWAASTGDSVRHTNTIGEQ